MKKRMTRLLLGMAFALALTGCGNAPAEDLKDKELSVETLVQNAHAMLEEADSFAADFNMIVAMGDSEGSKTEGTVALVKEPLYMKVDTVLSFGEQEQEYALYLEKTEDAVNQYMNYGGDWTEMTLSEESALLGVQIYHTLYNMEVLFSAVENWSVEEKEQGLELTGVIPEAKFYDVEAYTRWFQMAGMSGLSEVYFSGVGDVPVTVMLDEKTGAPISYSIELADALEIVTNNVLKELGSGDVDGGIEISAYTITSELTELGGVEAEPIPEEARNDAINYEKEISLLESEE